MGPEVGGLRSNDIAAMFVCGLLVIGCCAIPVVKMLLAHQQKMAELLRLNMPNKNLESELSGLRNDVSMIADRLNDLTLKLDAQPPLPVSAQPEQPNPLRSRT